MKLTIGLKILGGYWVALFALILLSVDAYVSVRHLKQNFQEVHDASDFMDLLEDFHDFVLGGMMEEQAYQRTGEARHAGRIETVKAGVDNKLLAMQKHPGAKDRTTELAELALASQQLMQVLGQKPELSPQGEAAHPNATTQDIVRMERLVKAIDVLKQLESKEFDTVNRETNDSVDALVAVIVYGAPIAVLVVALTGFLLARNITVPLGRIERAAVAMADGDFTVSLPDGGRSDEIGSLSRSFARMTGSLTELVGQVQRSGLQVNSSAVEISATAKQQQTTAGEVATTSAEISATAKEMSATSSELLKTADSVSVVAEQASELAAGGKEGLARMETIMRGILDASTSIMAKLGVMNEKAGNINAMVATIGKVADQTNLLSLNAAIEAEKAGEYGRGFAVVATEIRRLADQTAASTGDIEQMVREMVSAVSAGVMGMDKFAEELRRGAAEISAVGGQLDRVISEVQSLAPSVESVNEGMRSQTQGAQQISEALSQLGEAARLTADGIRDSARAIDQLNDATRGLQGAIAKFKLPG